jgi:hypothetical protein
MIKARFIFLAVCISNWPGAFAYADISDNTVYYGFVGQTLSYSNHNNFLGDTDDNLSADYRELGVGLTHPLQNNIFISAQLLSRNAGGMSNDSVSVDHGFIGYKFTNDAMRGQITIGKNKLPIGIYNETRDAPSTRPSIILPQSIYFDRTRNLANSQVSVRANYVFGPIDTDFIFGKTKDNDENYEVTRLGFNRSGSMEPDGYSMMTRLGFASHDDRLKLYYTYARSSMRYEPGNDNIGAGKDKFDLHIVSLVNSIDGWNFTIEYSRDFHNSHGYTIPAYNIDNICREKYYIQAEHFFSNRWSIFSRYEKAISNVDDPHGTIYAKVTGRPSYLAFQENISVGAAFFPTKNWILRGEVHFNDGASWLSSLENPVSADIERHWNLVMFQAAYSF